MAQGGAQALPQIRWERAGRGLLQRPACRRSTCAPTGAGGARTTRASPAQRSAGANERQHGDDERRQRHDQGPELHPTRLARARVGLVMNAAHHPPRIQIRIGRRSTTTARIGPAIPGRVRRGQDAPQLVGVLRLLGQAHSDRAVLATRVSAAGRAAVRADLPAAEVDEVGRTVVLGPFRRRRGSWPSCRRAPRTPRCAPRSRPPCGPSGPGSTWCATSGWPASTGCWPRATG